MTYDVTISFQYPAWDEKDGITYRDIDAATKAEAIARVRRQANRDGHIPAVGKGRATLKAVKAA